MINSLRSVQQLQQSINFLMHCMKGALKEPVCPECGPGNLRLLDRKYLFARLFECKQCRLCFRHPLDDADRLHAFYQSDYIQEDGITTDLPSMAEWDNMVRQGFGEKSVARYISLILSLFPGTPPANIRMLDYGCSWGYQTWQFRSAGFDCSGFEISVPRANYGRDRLGLPIYSDPQALSSGLDVFFSSHVIEHLPSPRRLLEEGFDLLKPGGYMMIESPNGAEGFRNTMPHHHHKLWGRVHPFLMTPDFYLHWLGDRPAFFSTHPFTDLSEKCSLWNKREVYIDQLEGPSLLMVTRKS